MDLAAIQKDVEDVLDSALGMIPGNPGVLLGLEKHVLSFALSALVSVITKHVAAASTTTVQVVATGPVQVTPVPVDPVA